MRGGARAVVLGLGVLGLVQLGSGGWIHAKAVLAQHLLERAWDQTLDGARRVRPWPWADTTPVAVLSIPRSGESMIVLEGASGRTLAFGPGHSEGTALPGYPGTAIVSGHRDTHFAVLRELERGDAIYVQRTDGRRVVYRVESLDVVDAREAGVRVETEGRSLVLVTCWPFDALRPGGPMRYVATARSYSF